MQKHVPNSQTCLGTSKRVAGTALIPSAMDLLLTSISSTSELGFYPPRSVVHELVTAVPEKAAVAETDYLSGADLLMPRT